MPYHDSLICAFRKVFQESIVIPCGSILFRGAFGEEQKGRGLVYPDLWLTKHLEYALDYAYWNDNKMISSVYKVELAQQITLFRVLCMRPIGKTFEELKANNNRDYNGIFPIWQRDNAIDLGIEAIGRKCNGIYLNGDGNSD